MTAPRPGTSDAPGGLLAPEPAVRTGALIGYARQVRHARDLLARPGSAVSSIARLPGVSRATSCKYVPEAATGRVAATAPGGEPVNGMAWCRCP